MNIGIQNVAIRFNSFFEHSGDATMMRAMIIGLIVLAVNLATGQETPPNLKLAPPRQSETKAGVFELPKSVTTAQLLNILSLTRAGYYDPMAVRQAVASRGDAVVPLLRELLMTDSLVASGPLAGPATDTTSSRIAVQTDRGIGYVVGYLDAIGTEKSFQVLLGAASTHANPNVRGGAIVTLGNSMHDQVCAGKVKADPEVIHVLMTCLDDTAQAASSQMKVGDLTRHALATWTGIELGPLDEHVRTVTVGKQKQVMSLKEYRDYAWKRIATGLTWAEGDGRFAIPK